MLKSNKGYNLAQNAKKKLPEKFTKILAILLLTAAVTVVPVALSSCGDTTAIHQTMSSVSVEEMNSFVKEYFKFPAVGSMSNPSSIAYSVSVENGKVYKIDMITTSEEPNGQVAVYFTTLGYNQGLSEKDIERKKNVYNSSFSNKTLKYFEAEDDVQLEDLYSEYLGESYIVAKEYSKSFDKGIEI